MAVLMSIRMVSLFQWLGNITGEGTYRRNRTIWQSDLLGERALWSVHWRRIVWQLNGSPRVPSGYSHSFSDSISSLAPGEGTYRRNRTIWQSDVLQERALWKSIHMEHVSKKIFVALNDDISVNAAWSDSFISPAIWWAKLLTEEIGRFHCIFACRSCSAEYIFNMHMLRKTLGAPTGNVLILP